MTAQEMQYNFELKIHEQNIAEKSFSSYDVQFLLNAAQNDLVEGFYSARINPRSRYFEMDERARAMLALLIENHTTTSFDDADAALHDNAVFVDLPSDFLYALKENCVVSYSDCNGTTTTKNTRVLPITHDEYEMNIDNVYKKPYRDLVWRMDFGDTGGLKKHELIHGSDITITRYNLRYLRKPSAIDIVNGTDCELNDMLHQEVVDRAVAAALRTMPQNVEPTIES